MRHILAGRTNNCSSVIGGTSVEDVIEVILTAEELEELLRDLPRVRAGLQEQPASG